MKDILTLVKIEVLAIVSLIQDFEGQEDIRAHGIDLISPK